MADVKPLKLVDQGGGAGRLAEFEAGDTLPKAALPALSAADVGAVAADDPRLSDAREWSAETVAQAEAEAGTATNRRAWTAQRVRQAIVAWWNSVSSVWGRGFVASADAAAGRTALGLGTAATRAVQTWPTDTTAGALMTVGAFGLGGADLPGLTDLDNRLIRPGFYICVNTTGAPSVYGVVHIVSNASGDPSSTWVHQVFYDTSGEVHERFSTNLGAWSPWRRMYHSGNIVGTVSQSAGIPTGAIIERGSNVNGEYVRFADGTQICHLRGSSGVSFFTWAFPAPFFIQPSVTAFTEQPSPANPTVVHITNIGAPTATVVDVRKLYLIYPGPGSFFNAEGEELMLTAIGRWY